MTDFNRVEVKLFKNSMPVREIEFKKDTADIIIEGLRFYWLNSEKLEKEMKDVGSQRLYYSAFNLKKDLQDVMDLLYGR